MTVTGSAAQSSIPLARQVVLRSWESSTVSLKDYARMVIDYAESRQEVTRRALTRRRLDLLRDSWGGLLKATFEAWTSPPVQDAVLGANRDHVDLSRNPAKRIWNELAVLYTAPPTRSTTPPGPGELYKRMTRRTRFEQFWRLAEVLVQACNDVLIWPTVLELSDGRKVVRHRYATGDAFTIITNDDDPALLDCVLLHDEWTDTAGARHKNWILWTDAWHAVFTRGDRGDLERQDMDEFGDAVNPYGVIPHVLIRRMDWQDVSLDATSGEDLVDGTLYGGHAQQFLRYCQKMSGFKQPAIVGEDLEREPQQQLLDPGATLKYQGQGISLHVIDWQLDLKGAQEIIDADELRMAAGKGINPERYKRTASYQTGLGARLSERPLERMRTEMVPVFDEAEASYYRSSCMVWGKHGLEAPDPDADFRVKHAPMQFPEDPASQLDIEGKELALFQTDYITLIKRRRPELTDDEAMELIRTYGGNIEEVQRMKVSHNIPSNPMNESASAEVNGAKGPVVRDGGQPPGSQPGDAEPKGKE